MGAAGAARGMRSIDVGCAQVNLMHHPAAFASLEQAFDPAANADYAGRFLKELRDTTAGGNWMTAAGHYHSQTPELAEPYRQQVQAVMAGGTAPMSPAASLAAARPSSPFGSTGPGRGLPAPRGARSAAGGPVGHRGARPRCLSRHADPDGGCHPPAADHDAAIDRRFGNAHGRASPNQSKGRYGG